MRDRSPMLLPAFQVDRRCWRDNQFKWEPVGLFFTDDLDHALENATRYLAIRYRVKASVLRATPMHQEINIPK